jgi:uncharacterized protein (TIGR02271 family)
MAEQPEREVTIPLIKERIEVAKRAIERGRVVIRTQVEEREELAEVDLRQEEVKVERVPVGMVVETAPPVREEDGVLVVPVLEEQLVIQTRLILKEELRITRTSRTEHVRQPVRLRAERAEVVRREGGNPDQPDPREGSSTDATYSDRDL